MVDTETKEQFIERYLENYPAAGILAHGGVVLYCNCSDDSCSGWQMVYPRWRGILSPKDENTIIDF